MIGLNASVYRTSNGESCSSFPGEEQEVGEFHHKNGLYLGYSWPCGASLGASIYKGKIDGCLASCVTNANT